MSARSDVLEMQSLCVEIADRTAVTKHIGSRIAAILDAFRPNRNRRSAPLISANRAYEFLRGKALRVDSWEKDIARQERERLRVEAEQREIATFLDRIAATRAYLEASDPDGYGPDIAALSHALDAARRAGCPVAVSNTIED